MSTELFDRIRGASGHCWITVGKRGVISLRITLGLELVMSGLKLTWINQWEPTVDRLSLKHCECWWNWSVVVYRLLWCGHRQPRIQTCTMYVTWCDFSLRVRLCRQPRLPPLAPPTGFREARGPSPQPLHLETHLCVHRRRTRRTRALSRTRVRRNL